MACILLGCSGAVRYWRDLQFLKLQKESANSPFPLKDIPYGLGTWRAVEGSEATLDPEIAKIAGSSDHIIRTYIDDKSGETATVLVLYGPSDAVWAHTPDVCYPSSGFSTVQPSKEVQVPGESPAGTTVFHQALYGKSLAGAPALHEVFYSFRNAGEWNPVMADQWKRFRYFPGMFKIQVERVLKGSNTSESPVPSLLSKLVEEIEKRSAEGKARPDVASSDAPASDG